MKAFLHFLTAILHRSLRGDFFSFSSDNLLFPISIWTFISLFFFGLLFPFTIWTFFSLFLFLFWLHCDGQNATDYDHQQTNEKGTGLLKGRLALKRTLFAAFGLLGHAGGFLVNNSVFQFLVSPASGKKLWGRQHSLKITYNFQVFGVWKKPIWRSLTSWVF